MADRRAHPGACVARRGDVRLDLVDAGGQRGEIGAGGVGLLRVGLQLRDFAPRGPESRRVRRLYRLAHFSCAANWVASLVNHPALAASNAAHPLLSRSALPSSALTRFSRLATAVRLAVGGQRRIVASSLRLDLAQSIRVLRHVRAGRQRRLYASGVQGGRVGGCESIERGRGAGSTRQFGVGRRRQSRPHRRRGP